MHKHILTEETAEFADSLQRQQLKTWFNTASYELTAAEYDKVAKLEGLLPAGCKISVVHLPNKNFQHNLEIIQKIKDHGFIPVPHIAAGNLNDRSELKYVLSGLQARGVDEALLIGGGLNNQNGAFKSTMDMLNTGYFEEYGITKFAFAGHPERLPSISEEDIHRAYEEKYRYFTENKLDFYVVTQFSFSVESVLNLVRYFFEKKMNVPIQIGVVGLCDFHMLLKYSLFCGIGNSLKLLKKEAAKVANIAKGYKTENFLYPFAADILNDEEEIYQAVRGIHVFPFGNIIKTYEYFKNYQ